MLPTLLKIDIKLENWRIFWGQKTQQKFIILTGFGQIIRKYYI